MVKGVGPQRAELLAKRGIFTLEDLLNYLPFRYEDRIHFSKIKDLQPNGVYTLRARVMSGQAVRGRYGRDAIYHLLVQDDSGSLACKFFHGGYLEGRLKPGQEIILHGKVEIDKLRPARQEMVNPQIEVPGTGEVDAGHVEGRDVRAHAGREAADIGASDDRRSLSRRHQQHVVRVEPARWIDLISRRYIRTGSSIRPVSS